jgi:SHS2 domain-containing protein
MAFRWVEHTSEVEVEIEAATEASVFEDALHAVAELLDGESLGEAVTVEVGLRARDRALLLAGWLDELVYQAEVESLIPEEVVRFELQADRLAASLRCRRGVPRPLVKGVTRHRLSFEPAAGGFQATVVLDV